MVKLGELDEILHENTEVKKNEFLVNHEIRSMRKPSCRSLKPDLFLREHQARKPEAQK